MREKPYCNYIINENKRNLIGISDQSRPRHGADSQSEHVSLITGI